MPTELHCANPSAIKVAVASARDVFEDWRSSVCEWLAAGFAAAALATCLAASVANAQLISLSDDIITLSRGINQQESQHKRSALGRIPGGGDPLLPGDPGGRDSRLENPADPARGRVRYGGPRPGALGAISVPQAVSRTHGTQISPQAERRALTPGAPRLPQAIGSDALELPHDTYEGPRSGLTLDEAIERHVQNNPDLRSKYYEIPQARADALTAGLRSNPFYFLSASSYPYQPYTPQRPGENQYGVSVVLPIDVNRKREARSDAAQRAVRVLEAQYQNAVRLSLAELYERFIDVLVARNNLRAARLGLASAEAAWNIARQRSQGEETNPESLLPLAIDFQQAKLRVRRAEGEWNDSKSRLAALASIPLDRVAQLEVQGRLQDLTPLKLSREQLLRTALACRPDLVAYRLGIARAQADVRVAQKEAFQDIFLIYSPWEYRNNRPTGAQNASSFSFGLMGSVPLFDRNQGDIRRAQANVAQTRAGLAATEREVANEVERAFAEYGESRDAIAALEQIIVPASERVRDAAYEAYLSGKKSLSEYLDVQREHNGIVHQYHEALILHRRSMLRINTVVARRILP